MSVANLKTSPSVRDQVSNDEWDARVNLAAAYRLVALYGWDDLVFTHISARVPGPEHHFLINPYGWMFEEITASSLVKVDLEARKVMPSPYDINPAGFTIHSAVHAAREDALCVMHIPFAHSCRRICAEEWPPADLATVAVGAFFTRLSRLRRPRAQRGGKTASGTRPRRKNFLMLRNHGLLSGRDDRGRICVHVRVRSELHDPSPRAIRRQRTDPDRQTHS